MSLLLLLIGAPARRAALPMIHYGGGGGGVRADFYDRMKDDLIRLRVLRDDQEIMDIIVIIVKSGILE